jgi:NAD(P)-dependent dehydrogenase (short-subunit alcohol dehydrogenase family)
MTITMKQKPHELHKPAFPAAGMNVDPKNYEPRPGMLGDRVILITGASDGIGKALAIRTAKLGAQVILHGRNAAKLEAVYDEIAGTESVSRPSIAVMDLATATSEEYISLADSIDKEFGRIDGLVQNAAILGQRLSIEQYDAAEWQRVLHVNLTAPFALAQVFLPLLKQSKDPSVVFTSSGVGREGRPYWGAYSVSKFGIEALSQILAAENRHVPIRVNCINPGPTRTDLRLQAYPAEERSASRAPEDVLSPYLFLLGPDSRNISGMSLDAQ